MNESTLGFVVFLGALVLFALAIASTLMPYLSAALRVFP
jgi:hypothetical protein